MSRGPGRVETIISAAFANNPAQAWTVAELCRLVWPQVDQTKHKHRVSVLRAAYNIAERHGVSRHKSGLAKSVVVFAGPAASRRDINQAIEQGNALADEHVRKSCAGLTRNPSQHLRNPHLIIDN